MTEEKKKEVIEILDAGLAMLLSACYLPSDQAKQCVEAFQTAKKAVQNDDPERFSIRGCLNERKLTDRIEDFLDKHSKATIYMSEETINDLPVVSVRCNAFTGDKRTNYHGTYEGYDILIDNDLRYGEVELR